VTCDRFSPGTPVSSTNKTDSYDIYFLLVKNVICILSFILTDLNFHQMAAQGEIKLLQHEINEGL
jgi:hypothetical protein